MHTSRISKLEVIGMRMNIEAERSRNGMTKTQMAEKLGVSLNTYNAYIKGAVMPSDKLLLLANLFNVSCDYLLERK